MIHGDNTIRMSSATSGNCSSVAVENEYMVVLRKRIRAYKKKLDRISALKDKKVAVSFRPYCVGHGQGAGGVVRSLRRVSGYPQ